MKINKPEKFMQLYECDVTKERLHAGCILDNQEHNATPIGGILELNTNYGCQFDSTIDIPKLHFSEEVVKEIFLFLKEKYGYDFFEQYEKKYDLL